jgi:N-acetylglucosamine-6-sulfatase
MQPLSTLRTIPPRRRVAVVVAVAALLAVLGAALATREAKGASPKNVIFILTDDQTTSEMSALPNVQSLLAAQGTTFRENYASYPLCCPSRATLMSAQYMHNHNVRGNQPPFGGWTRFESHESNDLPVWTHRYGYYNVHIGKYMNGYAFPLADPLHVPQAWDQWYGKVSEDSLYFNYQLIQKTSPTDAPHLTFYGDQPEDYQTDVFGNKADSFINNVKPSQTPFLMDVWFNAPHGPFDPAPRDVGKFNTTPLPRLPGFNEKDMSDKPGWLRSQAKKPLSKVTIKTIDSERRRQEEQLISVDQAVANIVQSLKDKGILDDTYIIFSSDNGFMRGEHRIVGGKFLPYDPSSRVPLIIRGPGIPAGGTSDEIVWNGDIPQTILDIASGTTDPSVDGRSLLPFARNPALRSTRPVLLEADTGPAADTPDTEPSATTSAARARDARVHVAGKRGVKNLDQEADPIASLAKTKFKAAPAYRAIRTGRYLYVLYANGQSELYDMLRDPAQLNNLAKDKRYRSVRNFLFNALIPLSVCAGPSCRAEIGPDPAPRGGKPTGKGGKGKGKK